MSFFKEFREFALKGNVMDMAVGVIIGGAFGKIVSSLVNDILMPPIGCPDRQYGLLVAAARHQQGARPLLESDTRSDRRNRVGYGGECSCGTDLVELRRIHPTVRGFRYPGLLRLSDGQDDEQADEEKTGSRAGHRCRNRPRRSCCLRRFGTCSGNKKK